MSILTEAQIEAASNSELLETVRAINSRLDGLDVEDVLRATRDTLAAHGIVNQVRVTIGVDEWDDGYFYSGIDHVENEQGVEIALPVSNSCAGTTPHRALTKRGLARTVRHMHHRHWRADSKPLSQPTIAIASRPTRTEREPGKLMRRVTGRRPRSPIAEHLP